MVGIRVKIHWEDSGRGPTRMRHMNSDPIVVTIECHYSYSNDLLLA
jgi:hypothetical protein